MIHGCHNTITIQTVKTKFSKLTETHWKKSFFTLCKKSAKRHKQEVRERKITYTKGWYPKKFEKPRIGD